MLESISSILNQGLGYIVPMIVLLGLLIFVHELGHFLAAKYFKVRVETFSLGFGPKIFKFVRGETVYCISALPLGGYVKMYGDEPGKDVPSELLEKSYLHKPVGQRIIVTLAGPLMNLFFAGFLFYCIANIGDKALSPIVGEIATNSEAFNKGFFPYDKIQQINDQKISTWDDVKKTIEENPEKSLTFKIDRLGVSTSVTVTPREAVNDNLFSTADNIGKIRGLNSNIHLPVVGVPYNGQLFLQGFRTGDRILEVEGQAVKWFKDLEPTIIEALSSGAQEAVVKVKRFKDFRDPKSAEDLTFTLKAANFKTSSLGFFVPQTVIAEVQKDSPAAIAGLMRNDQIVKINQTPIISFNDIVKNVSQFTTNSEGLEIEVLRQGAPQIFSIKPKMNSLEGQYGETENRFTIGVIPTLFAVPQTFVWKSEGIIPAAQRAYQQTYHWTKVTLLSFVRILQNKVSSKNISGIISIGQVAQQSWSIGLSAFLKMMAIISINLFVINLLPIPILDGGHLLLFTLEAIKGSPVSLKKIEIAQQIGFVFLLFLMAFALFNDFSRIFGS